MEKRIYNYNDVYNETLEYFNGDDLATNVWISKYSLKELREDGVTLYYEKSPVDMFHRIASELYRVGLKYENPMSYEEIYNLIDGFKYVIPQGRPMAGIGNNNDITSLSNCFAVGYPGMDSYGTIARVDQEIMQISKRGGGIGTDLSSYRPSNSKVKNAAMTSTGPVEICANRFSQTIREVGQNGRRGALMLSMDINHKDAEKFIDAKMEEGKVTGANISVKITDEWLKSFIDNENPNKENERLWKKIIYNAWKSAEPGVLFWDTIINESVPDCYSDFGFKTITTNPCFPSSEYILTKDGYAKFGDLYNNGTDNVVLTDNRISYIDQTEIEKPENWEINGKLSGTTERNASNVFLTKKNAEVIEVTLKRGFKLRCTPDHHIATLNRGMIEAKDLTKDDLILISTPSKSDSIIGKKPNSKDEIIAMLIGLIMGNGGYDKKCNKYYIDIEGNDKNRMSSFITESIDKLFTEIGEKRYKSLTYSVYKTTNKIRIYSSWLSKVFELVEYGNKGKLIIPEFIINNSRTNIGKFFIAGLYYFNGKISRTLNGDMIVILNKYNTNFLQKIQLILHSNGIICNITENKSLGKLILPIGNASIKVLKPKVTYELKTIKEQGVDFINIIGFLGCKEKESKRPINKTSRVENITDKMVSIEICDNEDVYCIKEPITRSIIVNGISTRRCGEIPLSNKDSCRLMLLNLYSYVDKPFTKEATFNYNILREHSKKIIKLMDNMIDLEDEKIDSIITKIKSDPEDDDTKATELNLWKEIKRVALLGRRSGIGVTGEGDMIAAMGFKYGTKEATEFSANVHRVLSTNVYIGSCDLVQIDNRPMFECFNSEIEKNNPFLNRLTSHNDDDSKELSEKIKRGRRNIACLTIPPAGSVSLLTQTTSGIEPAFSIYYKRKRKIDKSSDIKPDFIDATGDWFQEYFVISHKFCIWYSIKRRIEFNEAMVELTSMSEQKLDELIQESPYYEATSSDVNWVEKVRMQGEIQHYVDHSISSTTNVPKNTSEEVVRQIYEAAWKTGCKGMTIYREGSRDGVLTTTKDSKKSELSSIGSFPDKRPKTIQGKVVRFNNSGEKWVSVVGVINDKPYEIFTGLLDKLNIPQYVEDGFIVKDKEVKLELDENNQEIEKMVSRYDFQYKNKSGDIITVVGLSKIFKEEYWNYAKLISGLLRNNMPIQYVIKTISSLNLGTQNINSWKNGVVRTLKKFIKDGTLTGDKCPDCGAELVRESGCISCKKCGWSKCG